MDNSRLHLKLIGKQRKELEKQIQLVSAKLRQLDITESRIRTSIVETEKLLGVSSWDLRLQDARGNLSLSADVRNFPGLSQLCNDGWGLRLRIEKVNFYEHDGHMIIDFKDVNKMLEFIIKYGLKVSTKNMEGDAQKLEKGAKAILSIIEHLRENK